MSGSGAPLLPETGGREDRLLSWARVHDVIGLSRSTAWRLHKAGAFPGPIAISPGRVGWWESEITAWKKTRGAQTLGRPAAPRFQGMPRLTKPRPSPLAAASTPSSASVGETAEPPRRRRRASPVHPGQIDFGF